MVINWKYRILAIRHLIIMKTLLRLFALFVLLTGCQTALEKESDPRLLDELEGLREEQGFFKLRGMLESQENKLSESHALYYSAILDNAFNHPERSNENIAKLVGETDIPLNDTLLKELYNIKLQNHTNLYEYSLAAETNAFIRENYGSLLDSADLADLQNTNKIWTALKDIPKQQVIRNSDFNIPMERDKVGLSNIEVALGADSMNMVFDTGANLSVLARSYVDKLGLKLIKAGFSVGALTGARINSDLAVADSLSIGGLKFRHVVFLVFDDEDLSIPQVDYHINGIIGYPVIEAMEELRISRDGQLFVPREPASYTYNNMALDGFTPIVAGSYRGDTLRFHLDTGAPGTSLFALFYRKYREEIDTNYEKTVFKSGGAGGVVEFEGYIIDDLPLKIAGSTVSLDSLPVHIADIGGRESNFHGNLGQDYIRQFDEMIISFKHSSLLFR